MPKNTQKPWMRWRDSNTRPRGYEPRELTGCSTPLFLIVYIISQNLVQISPKFVNKYECKNI